MRLVEHIAQAKHGEKLTLRRELDLPHISDLSSHGLIIGGGDHIRRSSLALSPNKTIEITNEICAKHLEQSRAEVATAVSMRA